MEPRVPHIDVEILGEICRQTSCGRRTTDRFQHEVVRFVMLLHAQVSEVECTGPKARSCQMSMGIGSIHVVTTPPMHEGRRLHGSQW